MRNAFAVQLLLLSVLGGLAAPLLSSADAAESSRTVALVSAGRNLLEWTPLIDFESITLALADPRGLVRTHHFNPGEAPVLSLFDAQGLPLPDGTYTWELRVTPRPGAGGVTAPGVQSGYFTISGGALVSPDSIEPSAGKRAKRRSEDPRVIISKDQVVPDDLIVDGKGCIGLGCASNEAFGAEALRLKQAVVRLRFEDTSSQAGFPARDWQLSANDAASGGADRFFLEDLTAATTPLTVRGGAPNNSLYVDAQGKVGLGTAAPAQRLHVTGAATPAVRLEQTGGTPRTWDLAADATSFRLLDVTNASAAPVQVAAGAPANSLVIAANGSVGIGVSPPAVSLNVVGNVPSDAGVWVRNTSSTGFSGISFYNHSNVNGFFFGLDNAKSETRLNSVASFPFVMFTNNVERIRILPLGNIGMGCNDPAARLVIGSGGAASCTTPPFSSINPGAATFTTSSSRSFKEHLVPVEVPDILDTIAGVGVYHYDFINGPKDRIGLMAEDFHGIFERGSDKVIEGGEVEMALWLAVQKLAEESKQERQRNRELEERNSELEQRLRRLEAMVVDR
jgi:hypothetical protein